MTLEVTVAVAMDRATQAARWMAPATVTGVAPHASSRHMPAATGSAARRPMIRVRSGGLGTNTARPTITWVRTSSTAHSSPGIAPGQSTRGRETAVVDTMGKAASTTASAWRESRPRRHPSHIAR